MWNNNIVYWIKISILKLNLIMFELPPGDADNANNKMHFLSVFTLFLVFEIRK